jgi:hypothetical protein
MIAIGISLVNMEVVMASQAPVQISTFQYWMWKLKHLPNSVLLGLNVFFAAIIVLLWTKPIYIPEWYPGGVKPYPSIEIVHPTTAPLPTMPGLPPVLPAPPEQQQPVRQPEPIVGVFVPQEPVVVEESIPTVEALTTPPPTANEATVEAWVAAPVSTPTSSPAPGEPGFAESFYLSRNATCSLGMLGGNETTVMRCMPRRQKKRSRRPHCGVIETSCR